MDIVTDHDEHFDTGQPLFESSFDDAMGFTAIMDSWMADNNMTDQAGFFPSSSCMETLRLSSYSTTKTRTSSSYSGSSESNPSTSQSTESGVLSDQFDMLLDCAQATGFQNFD